MKQIISAALVACLCLSLTACSAKPATEEKQPEKSDVSQVTAAQETTQTQPVADEPEEFTYVGRWKLDMDRIDTEAFFAAFGTSAHEGAQMNITEDGKMNFWIGVTGGYGKYMPIEAGFVCKVTTYNEEKTENYIIQPDAEARVILMNIDSVELFWVRDENAAADMENELMEKLVGISQDVHVGAAGSRMQAVKAAADLMDWADYLPMSKDSVYKVVGDYMQVKDTGGALDEFVMQIVAVEDAYRTLLTDGQEDMLESAGVENSHYPWGSIEVVENIISAVYAD